MQQEITYASNVSLFMAEIIRRVVNGYVGDQILNDLKDARYQFEKLAMLLGLPDESPSEQPVEQSFWDVAHAFKWASEYRDERGGQLTLYNDQWTLIREDEDGNEKETDDLTPGNVAELYCVQNGFRKEGQPVEQISQDAHEKEVMMKAFGKIRQIFEGRQWITEGRGSYPYNDDRYREEVRYMYDEFEKLFKDTWGNIKSKSCDYRQAIIAEYVKGEQKENEADIDELWDEHSEHIDDDIDSLSRWAGSTVVDKEQFKTLVAQLWELLNNQKQNKR